MNIKNSKELCSICCLGYKHKDFLEYCIKSIWNNSYKNIEIIALDDGSNDGSVDLLEELQKQSPCPLEIIAQDNSGNIGKNFNTMLHKAKGEYILFIALDDALYPDAIEKMISPMQKDTHIAFVASAGIMRIDNTSKEKGARKSTLAFMNFDTITAKEVLELEYNEFHSFFIQSSLLRKSIVGTVGGFDEDMTGDDIILRTKLLRFVDAHSEYKFKIIPDLTCYYRTHGNNIHKNHLRQMKILTEYFERYWSERENPRALTNRCCEAIANMDNSSLIELFNLNTRAKSLFNEEDVQQAFALKLSNPNLKMAPEKILRRYKRAKKLIIVLLCLMFFQYLINI